MKIEVTAVEVWVRGTLVKVFPVADAYSHIVVNYPTDAFTLEQLKQALLCASVNTRRDLLGAMADGDKFITFEGEAKDLPCVGDVIVACVTKQIHWPEELK